MTATAIPYSREACANTYDDTVDLIRHTVHAFRRKFGGDFNELMSQAHLHYMAAYRDFCAGKMADVRFHTALRNYVWYGLFDRYRQETGHRNKGLPPVILSMSTVSPNGVSVDCESARAGYDPEDYRAARQDAYADRIAAMFEELSDDAAACVRLVFDMPPELAAVAEAKGGTPRNIRSTLRQALADMGWAADRIRAAFEEVAEVIS